MLTEQWETIDEVAARTGQSCDSVMAVLQVMIRDRKLSVRMETRENCKVLMVKIRQ